MFRIHYRNVPLFNSKHEVSIRFCFKQSLASFSEKPFLCQAKYGKEKIHFSHAFSEFAHLFIFNFFSYMS